MGKSFCALLVLLTTSTGWAAGTPFGFPELKQLVETEKPTRLEELLPHLPNSWLTNYVLMEKSRSAQGASRAYPRVILFGEGDLMLAFNGHPAQRGHQVLEAIEYDRARGQYEFRAIDFSSGTAVVSPPNPSRCTLCHQNPLRPNWEPYPFWPGAVGEHDTISADEVEYLEQFAREGASHPRYRHLKRQANLDQIQSQILKFTPAMAFNTRISGQRTHRIARLARYTPEYEKFRWATLGSVLDCAAIPSFLPQGALLGGEQEWARLLENTEKHSEATPPRHRRLLDAIEDRIVTNLRFLFESRSLSIRPWFNSFNEPYLFSTVANVDARNVATEMRKLDPELKQLSYPSRSLDRHLSRLSFPTLYEQADRLKVDGFCTQLRFKSLTAFYD